MRSYDPYEGSFVCNADAYVEYNETQCDKRNTYRRKVKEEKAAAVVKDADETPADGDTTTSINGGLNGHAEGDDADRPTKKLKGDDGSAFAPDPDGTEDEDIGAEEDDQENQHDDDDDDQIDDEDDEAEDNADDRDAVMEDPDTVDAPLGRDMRDEALDDPDDDSD